MASDDETQRPESPLFKPIKKVGRVLSEGYYGATYKPEAADPLGAAVTEAVRHGPFFLALRDLWTCINMFTLFPGVVTPFFTTNPTDEFYPWGFNLWGLILLSTASIFEVLMLAACIPVFLLFPGPLSLILFISGQVMIHIICYPMQGPSKVWSRKPTDPKLIAKFQKNKNERWFFLNGCCVSGHNLQQNLNVLSETFGRPLFAIHNRTYGVIGDLFECILQRAFNLFTEESRVSYEYVKSYTLDPSVTKVVLIAHSQGCIMASQILDQLYLDLPAKELSKLEVYTFGNAASHFNNPLRAISSTGNSIDARDIERGDQIMSNGEKSNDDGKTAIKAMLPERVIPYIEHYCNSQDMVTRWGALYSAKSILQNRFCGHIFINEGASGHMLNQHYLSDMFPIHHLRAGAGHVAGTSSEAMHGGVPFLDRIVRVDTATITHQGSDSIHKLAILRHESGESNPSDHSHVAHETSVDKLHSAKSIKEREEFLKLGEGKELTSKDLAGAEGSRISVVKVPLPGDEYKGKTVRQLSRLWRYMDGANPDE